MKKFEVIADVRETPCSRENQDSEDNVYSLIFGSIEEMETWERGNTIAMYRTDGKANFDVKIISYQKTMTECRVYAGHFFKMVEWTSFPSGNEGTSFYVDGVQDSCAPEELHDLSVDVWANDLGREITEEECHEGELITSW